MGKVLFIKIEYQDELRKIPVTEVREEHGRILAFDSATKVGSWPSGKIEYWHLEDAPTASAAPPPTPPEKW
jgi:hypothetical protein